MGQSLKIQQGADAWCNQYYAITEDIVTLASDAAADILNDDDKSYRYGHRGRLTSQRLLSMFTVLGFNLACLWNSEACYAATAGLNY